MSDTTFDPFDMEALKAAPPTEAVESVLTGITVRKPAKTEFFRVHPDPAMIADGTTLEFDGEGSGREQTYWVPPAFRAAVGDLAKAVRLRVCINRYGVLFIWPMKLPTDNFGRSWADSAMVVAEEAERQWVRMSADMRAGRYSLERATGDIGDPDWGDHELPELLKLGFGDNVIASLDSPVLKKLRGEI